MGEFYQLSYKQAQLLRSRRAECVQTITEADKHAFTVWVFCVWCGHSHLVEARWLVAQVKDPPNMLDELEKRLRCSKCNEFGIRLIVTDRTGPSFQRMGASRRD